MGDEHLRKQHRVLADLHYSKAAKLFQLLKDAPCELLRVQLERVAFAEFQMTSKSRCFFVSQIPMHWLSVGLSRSETDLWSLSDTHNIAYCFHLLQ